MAPEPPRVPRIPELEADYELLRELGRGGAAAVFLGRERAVGRFVAIKLVHPDARGDEEAAARLHREARMTARLRHPNVVSLLGARNLAFGQLALVFEFESAPTLRRRLDRRGRLSFAEAQSALRDLALALAHAHAHRIVHRDLKPHNVFVDEVTGRARLSDFGLARVWDSDSTLTLSGSVLGTPAYMSPEQIDGRTLDGRSDLYSLGVVGYEILAGRHPWAHLELSEMLHKQRHEALPPLASLRPGAPERIERAIEGALAKDPRDRWQDASELLRALERGGEPSRRALPEARTAELDYFDCWDPPAEPASRPEGPAVQDGAREPVARRRVRAPWPRTRLRGAGTPPA